jgi:hypothetical protein
LRAEVVVFADRIGAVGAHPMNRPADAEALVRMG